MRLRKQELGDRNLVGNRVELVRKQKGMKQKELLAQLQVNGVDMNASGLSKLEGQIRFVTDVELVALADILEVSVDYLLGRHNFVVFIYVKERVSRVHKSPAAFNIDFACHMIANDVMYRSRGDLNSSV